MLPDRRFRRLDRDRLAAASLARAWPLLCGDLERLVTAREAFAAGAGLPGLHVAIQGLVDRLNAAFELPRKRVFVRDRPRPHRRRGGRIVYELHGQCDPQGTLEVYARTAARARPVALLTLLNTVLHEWVHHYDFARHGASVHCSGFYERLAQVYRPARDRLSRG